MKIFFERALGQKKPSLPVCEQNTFLESACIVAQLCFSNSSVILLFYPLERPFFHKKNCPDLHSNLQNCHMFWTVFVAKPQMALCDINITCDISIAMLPIVLYCIVLYYQICNIKRNRFSHQLEIVCEKIRQKSKLCVKVPAQTIEVYLRATIGLGYEIWSEFNVLTSNLSGLGYHW